MLPVYFKPDMPLPGSALIRNSYMQEWERQFPSRDEYLKAQREIEPLLSDELIHDLKKKIQREFLKNISTSIISVEIEDAEQCNFLTQNQEGIKNAIENWFQELLREKGYPVNRIVGQVTFLRNTPSMRNTPVMGNTSNRNLTYGIDYHHIVLDISIL